ncbi:ribonuclease III family protein [Lachnospiraceae bacterium KM106-2]|nr:ribonuclease III family protein [Lachnospiraceae bacterium KM106-2]
MDEVKANDKLNNCEIVEFLKNSMDLADVDVKTYSPLVLAYIGDCIYDLVIRTMILAKGNAPVNKIHKTVSSYVKANAQMKILHIIEDELTEEEMAVYKRGRNAKSFTSAKNATIVDYRTATGFEALLGYLYLKNRMDRIMELVNFGLTKLEV